LNLQVGFSGWDAGCRMVALQLLQVVQASMQKDTTCTCADADTIGGAWRAAKPALEKLPLVLLLPAEAFARPVEDL
jgi:hypothetical protein